MGSARFRRLLRCSAEGLDAPVDGRSLTRSSMHRCTKKLEHRIKVVEFLQELYETLSEPMPETQGPVRGNKDMKFRRHCGKRPKAGGSTQSLKVRRQMRLLPPGSYTDYLNMLRSRWPGERFSLKLFTKAPNFMFLVCAVKGWIENVAPNAFCLDSTLFPHMSMLEGLGRTLPGAFGYSREEPPCNLHCVLEAQADIEKVTVRPLGP